MLKSLKGLITLKINAHLDHVITEIEAAVALAILAGTSPRPTIVAILDRALVWGGPVGRLVERIDGGTLELLAQLIEGVVRRTLERARDRKG